MNVKEYLRNQLQVWGIYRIDGAKRQFFGQTAIGPMCKSFPDDVDVPADLIVNTLLEVLDYMSVSGDAVVDATAHLSGEELVKNGYMSETYGNLYHAFVYKFIHQGFELKFKGAELMNACKEFAHTHPEVKLIDCEDGCSTGSTLMIFSTSQDKEIVIVCAPQYGNGSYLLVPKSNEIIGILKNMFDPDHK